MRTLFQQREPRSNRNESCEEMFARSFKLRLFQHYVNDFCRRIRTTRPQESVPFVDAYSSAAIANARRNTARHHNQAI
jgi:hypothetical protein